VKPMTTAPSNSDKKLSNQRALIAVALICLACFLSVALTRGYFTGLNASVNEWAVGIQTDGLTQTATFVADRFDTTFLLAVSVPVFCLLMCMRQFRGGILLAGAMCLDAVLLQLSKIMIVSPRPLNCIVVEGDYSFPSGHVTSTIVFFGTLTYIAWQNRSLILKACFGALTPAVAVCVGFDRLYLNAHWLSDVLAAPFLAVFVIATSILIVQQLTRWYKKRKFKAALGGASSPLNLRGQVLNGRAITPPSLHSISRRRKQ
jgi:undecaprenyl-diphosphatase